MQQKVFLKLDGVTGESKSPQHLGEIELIGFNWGGFHSSGFAFGEVSGKVMINDDLTIIKQSDQTSSILMLASVMQRNFAEGRLTIEDVSESGNLLRSIILKLRIILINSINANRMVETITLNFKRAKLMRPRLRT